MKRLNGYKTYLGFLGVGITGLLLMFGLIDQETAVSVFAITGGLAGIGGAHKVEKLKEVAIR